MVTLTVFVNGSTFSSQACWRRCSALSAPGLALSRASSTARSLLESSIVCSSGDGGRQRVKSIPAAWRMRLARCGSAAVERADTQDELGEVKRLGQVVVGAKREPLDAIVGGAGGGEHQDHRGIFAMGDDPAQAVAVDAREVAIEQDDVVGVEIDLRDRFVAVVGDVDRDPLVAQPFCDPIGVAGYVLDDEDSHSVAFASCWDRCGRERDLDAEPAFCASAELKAAVVRGGDRGDDREPEAVAVL